MSIYYYWQRCSWVICNLLQSETWAQYSYPGDRGCMRINSASKPSSLNNKDRAYTEHRIMYIGVPAVVSSWW